MKWTLHFKKLGKLISCPWRLLKKLLYDVWSTLYDDQGFKIMSLPRFFCFGMFSAVIAAWIFEQCMKMPFEHFAELTGAFGIAMGGYVGKKIAERPMKVGGDINAGRNKNGGNDSPDDRCDGNPMG